MILAERDPVRIRGAHLRVGPFFLAGHRQLLLIMACQCLRMLQRVGHSPGDEVVQSISGLLGKLSEFQSVLHRQAHREGMPVTLAPTTANTGAHQLSHRDSQVETETDGREARRCGRLISPFRARKAHCQCIQGPATRESHPFGV